MTIGSSLTLDDAPSDVPKNAPVSLTSRWITAIDATGMDDVDAATITNPTTGITLSTRHIIGRSGDVGTNLMLRMAYAGTSSVSPIVKVFGRTGSDAWQVLKNKAGNVSATVQTNSTDATDGTLSYTTVDNNTIWDCLGCDEFLVGVETAYAVSAGSAATALLQAKMI
jgi:hypothetical protein